VGGAVVWGILEWCGFLLNLIGRKTDAEALELPGVMTYGATREEAGTPEKLAIEVIAD
jgi:hypothetical protein